MDLRDLSSFADYFVIMSGTNVRQNQAISDEIYIQMKDTHGMLPFSYECYNNAEWILLDYGAVVVGDRLPDAIGIAAGQAVHRCDPVLPVEVANHRISPRRIWRSDSWAGLNVGRGTASN